MSARNVCQRHNDGVDKHLWFCDNNDVFVSRRTDSNVFWEYYDNNKTQEMRNLTFLFFFKLTRNCRLKEEYNSKKVLHNKIYIREKIDY